MNQDGGDGYAASTRASRFRATAGGSPKTFGKKYRRFTGRRGAANTGKVIEIAKEKAKRQNRVQNRGNRREYRRALTHRPAHVDTPKTNRPPPRGAGRIRPRLGFQP